MSWEGGLSIDELLNELRGYDPATVLSPGFNEAGSYRGYYECLGLEPCPKATVREMTEVLLEAKGATYPGYKGGDYTMDGDTECFLAEYGSSGVPITREWVDLIWKARPELTEAQARIAELEAEAERLREALRRIPIHHTGRHYALHTARGVFVDDTGGEWISAVGALLRDEEAKP